MNKTKKILIISSNRLGDSIMSSGLHQFFKKEVTNKITLVCGKVPSELFKYCENIDRLITLNKRKLLLSRLRKTEFLFFLNFLTFNY